MKRHILITLIFSISICTFQIECLQEKKKIKKWQCFGNGYLMATCPHTKGQMADMTFIEVMLDRQFSDNKILK